MPTTAIAQTRWIAVPAPNPAAQLRLVCFPYAGAGASIFSSWPQALPSDVEMWAVQMPGRETRLGERPLTRLEGVLERCAEAVLPRMDRPFVFFGHSLGATVAFEIARRFCRDHRWPLVRLIVSGRTAPQLPSVEPPISHLPDEQLVSELRRFAGTPEEVLQDPEMMELFLPLLRADFYLSETYVYQRDAPLGVPISAYGGDGDEWVAPAALEPWREHTIAAFRQVIFKGGHLFLNENRAAVLSELARELGTLSTVRTARLS